jgi:diguanylate cyclase (GGDEF)-like protein
LTSERRSGESWLVAFALAVTFVVLGSPFVVQGFAQVASPPALSATGAVPAPPSIPISPRRSAAFGAVIVAGLLLLQYAHRRKAFILLWAAGWLLIAPAMLLIARGYENPLAGNFAVGLSQFLGICTATLFFWSADLYRHTQFVRPRRLRVLLGVAAWFLLAPLALGPSAVLTPGYLISAIVLAAAGAMYAAVLIERRMIGAGLVAFVLLGLGVSNLTTAVVVPRMLATGQFTFEILVVNAVLYTFGALGIHQLVFEDMTYELRIMNRRLEAAREELLQAAITDPLTGCHNRRFLEQVMDRELQRHKRFQLPLSLLFIDVNKFKQINDTLGHEAGDRVLQYVARFLKRHIREADYIFRWGGDEFLVLITCSAEEAARKAAVLKASFDAAPEAVELPPGIGLSVGWADVPPGTEDLLPLVKEADARMYVDKGRAAKAQAAPVPAAAARPRPRGRRADPAMGRQSRRDS